MNETAYDSRLSGSMRFPFILVIFLSIWTAAFALFAPKARNLTADDWSYYELSSTVFKDFFHANTVRQFVKDHEYSNAFPPLWPIVIALFRSIHDAGISTGLIANIFICVLLAMLCIGLVRRMHQADWIGSLVYFAIFAQPQFRRDFWGGGPMPLHCVWLIAGVMISIHPKLDSRRAVLLGAICGFGMLTRYDFALVSVVLALNFCIRAWRTSGWIDAAKLALLAALTGLVVLSPWISFNMNRFGAPFASDNSRQLMSNRPIHVMDYFAAKTVPSMASDPIGWIRGAFSEKLKLLAAGAYWGILVGSWLPAIFAVRVAIQHPASHNQQARLFAQLTLILLPAMLLPAWLTGYGRDGNGRYFIGAIVILTSLLLIQIAEKLDSKNLHRVRKLTLIGVLATLTTSQGTVAYLENVSSRKTKVPITRMTPELDELAHAMRNELGGSNLRVLIASGVDPFAFGALTGIRVCPLPYSGDWELKSLLKEYRIGLIYDPDGLRPKSDSVILTPLSHPGLYLLENPPN